MIGRDRQVVRPSPPRLAAPKRRPTHRLAALAGSAMAAVVAAMCAMTGLASALPTLPDNRVYEKVSPVDKGNADAGPVIGPGGLNVAGVHQAAYSEDAIVYGVYGSFAGNAALGAGYNHYLARRDPATGWATQGIDPPINGGSGGADSFAYMLFSDEVERGLINSGASTPLAPGASPTEASAYMRDNRTGAFSLMTPSSILDGTALLGSSDLSHFVWSSTPGATPPHGPGIPDDSVWEHLDGQRRLVSVLPSGDPTPAALGSGRVSGGAGSADAVSDSGHRIVFTSPEFPFVTSTDGEIYVREADADPPATYHVSAPMAGAPAQTTRAKVYMGATPDVGRVLFASIQALTPDAITGPTQAGLALYRHDLESGRTIVISRDTSHADGARVRGVTAYSEDGDRVYFVASGTLGTAEAVDGQPNLFLWEDDGTRFADDGQPNGRVEHVATLTAAETKVWAPRARSARRARVSHDGAILAFESAADPALDASGYDTGGATQVYIYDAVGDEITCVSCRGSSGAGTQSFLRPLPDGSSTPALESRLPRNLSRDASRLFFTSTARLLAEDINDQRDVYQYDLDDGELHLISTGDSTSPATFWDADATGEDVFFTTRAQLVEEDTDSLVDLYTARVGGRSFAPPSGSRPCTGDSCQGAPHRTSAPPALGSAVVRGADEVVRPARPARIGRVTAAQRRRFARTGRLVIRVFVPRGGQVRIAFNRGKNRTLRVRRAGSRRVVLRLSKHARRVLRRKGSVRVRIAVRFDGTNRRMAMTLRRAK